MSQTVINGALIYESKLEAHFFSIIIYIKFGSQFFCIQCFSILSNSPVALWLAVHFRKDREASLEIVYN